LEIFVINVFILYGSYSHLLSSYHKESESQSLQHFCLLTNWILHQEITSSL